MIQIIWRYPYNIALRFNLKKGDAKAKYLLLIAGEGELHQELQEKANQLGVNENVKFLGLRSDVPYLLQAMDIFVLPSLYEGLPVGGVEAQTAGLPCLFSDAITKEVDLIKNRCKYLSINNPDIWITEIMKLKSVQREDKSYLVKSSGYDISEEGIQLSNIYRELARKK